MGARQHFAYAQNLTARTSSKPMPALDFCRCYRAQTQGAALAARVTLDQPAAGDLPAGRGAAATLNVAQLAQSRASSTQVCASARHAAVLASSAEAAGMTALVHI